MSTGVDVSVIIPTVNRAQLLQQCLEGFANQTVSPARYEVVVVDDGSTDSTPAVCTAMSERMQLRYVRIQPSGISAAKNAGVRAAQGPIVLFADDDDLGAADLIEQHLDSHARHPQEDVAVLGFLMWAPTLPRTPVMQWTSDFGFEDMQDDQVFNFEFFWGGLSSCKRSHLLGRGLFNPRFSSIIEDIELAYRVGLRVAFNRRAVSHMIRPLTFAVFCDRCQRQGRALYMFSRFHADAAVQDYCRRNLSDPDGTDCIDVAQAPARWRSLSSGMDPRLARVQEIEEHLAADPPEKNEPLRDELNRLYRWTFDAFKIKGVADATADDERAHAGA